ncbi:Hydantoinase/oxoprolinase N-terminal region [Acididesulfobacillus acetoxydans]|uniref:Hydantoinase/oxoprolinase N-terminal region n=1 Tax=Acididesulfobacillus acetoxydans TaxID=1561005 RepID=A0A8S0WAG3_9FIRM|nr:hydantoinase/oxoprolinase family protein [Acididesulfobacillus acetoxydans]CAA7603429.1 Hydantoinase/oxoprolinase N-terminal region [Acididesulfobacillus acetoxydans]CEJ07156.1 N-methylhydantoinase A/acetone carboxylase, beta subunit [Acididesulfobacillus acetoxydans]
MSLALGIDTGGTYTDGVLLDLESEQVMRKAKAFTTREDLSIGILGCIENLHWSHLDDVSLVALSTTLATNAIIEDRGCRVGLILIGHEPTGDLPAQEIVAVAGGHDIKGNPLAKLDVLALNQALTNMQGKVDTLAISGFLSVRNPEHELQALEEVKNLWQLPVVCAHQLTTALGFYERTVTACLNARLLPIIAEWLVAVKSVLAGKNIKAPLMVVKGDGSLMSEEVAREKPIQTILSGPAASIVGATFLTGCEQALVLDMGGTTTDIAIIEKGRPGLNIEGATVGGWKTRVEAAEISTFGLGGDSYIQVSRDGKMSIGPKRVWSLAASAEYFPHLVDELMELSVRNEVTGYQPVDCWMLVKGTGTGDNWSEDERQVIQALQDGAHNIFVLAERTGQHVNLLPMARLEQAQVVGRISLTPTDLLHAAGKFTRWSAAPSIAAARLQAERIRMPLDDFVAAGLCKVQNAVSCSILQSLLYRQGLNIDISSAPGAKVFLERFLAGQTQGGLGVEMHLDYPIVAVGAPVSAYLPDVGNGFHTDVFIPEHAEVANAVGAAVGQIVETVRVLIKAGDEGGFLVHAPGEREAFLYLDEAEKWAVDRARKVAHRNAKRAGAIEPYLVVTKEEAIAHSAVTDGELFVEMRIEVTAVGRPGWGVGKE